MIFFLAKFFNEEPYAEQFMRGRLYANKLAYFRKLEGDSNRADAYEGVGLLRGDLDLSVSIDGSQSERIIIPECELAEPIEVRMNWTEHVNLLCMYAAHSGTYTNIADDRIDQFKKEQIEIPKECLEFGQYAVLITNVLQFVKRVKDAVRKTEDYGLVGRLVRYGGKPPIDVTGVDTIFHKREHYKNQREYRFAVFTGSDIRDPLILETGDLSDIAIRCNSVKINEGIQISFRSGNGQSGHACLPNRQAPGGCPIARRGRQGGPNRRGWPHAGQYERRAL